MQAEESDPRPHRHHRHRHRHRRTLWRDILIGLVVSGLFVMLLWFINHPHFLRDVPE